MLWLEATVAFALSMFVFSTVVSGVLEAAHRLIGMREKGLRMMLERAFDDLSQRLRIPADDARREKFVGHMTANPMAPRLRGVRVARTSLCSLPVEEFLARLAETELGDEIARLGRARFDPLIKDVARRYERIGAAASSYFQQRARTVTVVLSLALALVANIDGVRLFRTFLVDPVLTESFVARAEGLGAERPGPDADVSRAPAGPNDLKTEARRISDPVRELAAATGGIGWGLYPFSDEYGATDHLHGLTPRLRGAVWLLSVLLTGLLIGLGGPFWFDAVTGLARLLGIGATPAKAGAAAAAAAPTLADSIHPSSPSDAFETPRASRADAAARRVRRPLGRDGKPSPS